MRSVTVLALSLPRLQLLRNEGSLDFSEVTFLAALLVVYGQNFSRF